MQLVWPGTIVDESNVFQNLYVLRKTLGQKPDGSAYIETLRGRGYRFAADVRRTKEAGLLASAGSPGPDASGDRQFSNGTLILGAAVLTSVLVTAVASVFYRPWSGVLVGSALIRELPDSMAVIPFRTLGVAPASDELGQGLCDALITKLGNVPQLGVRPTSSVRR